MKILLYSFFLSALFCTLHANAEINTQCFSESEGEDSSWAYCLFKTEGSKSKDVLYYFHGIMGGEKDWVEGSNSELRVALRARWTAQGVEAPTVVVISLGQRWLVNDENYELLSKQLFPIIEEKLKDHRGRRMIMGVSMGGFNTLQMLFRNPQAWDKAVLIAPMIPVCDPFLPERALYMCIAADPYKNNVYAAYQSHMMAKEYFPEKELWTQFEPINLAKTKLHHGEFPPFLLSTGTADEFAFFTKSENFAKIAKSKGADVKWLPTELMHAIYDPNAIADFLAE